MNFKKIKNFTLTQLRIKKIKLIHFFYNCKIFDI